MLAKRIILLLGLSGILATAPLHAQCVGDCDGRGTVTIEEVVRGVAIVLGEQPSALCPNAMLDCTVCIDRLVNIVRTALHGCLTSVPSAIEAATATPPPNEPDATPTSTPEATPTTCRAVIPLVAPVSSPTDQLEQTIYLCGIIYSTSHVEACGPAGCAQEFLGPRFDCALRCPDSRQLCFSAVIPLLPDQVNMIQVCQVPGLGCGPLPDLCAEEDAWGNPLAIEQRSGE